MRNTMRALSVKQPYAEQIMRKIKKVEYRTFPTHIFERVYIYASLTPGEEQEFAKLKMQPGDLPTGVIIGTVEITCCTGKLRDYEWHLDNPRRLRKPIKPKNHPQPAWFYPFK